MVRSQVKRTKSIFVDKGNVNKLGASLRYIKLLPFLQKRDLEQLNLTLAYTSTDFNGISSKIFVVFDTAG